MGNGNVVDFFPHFKRKQNKQLLQEKVNAAGWEMDTEITGIDSDVCLYLMDTKESSLILFGTQFEHLPTVDAAVSWKNLVLAWDVIADPEMPFDETHKRSTIELSLECLAGVENWASCRERLLNVQKEKEKRAHLLVLIDREDTQGPRELIVAYSKDPVLNKDSLHAIVESYLKN